MLVAPSILAADYTQLAAAVERIEQAGADLIHVDIMDGHFVPPISFGGQFVRALRSVTQLPLDVHMMVSNPESQLVELVAAGADWLTFHIEATIHAHRLASEISKAGCKVGVSLVPSTPVEHLTEILALVDLVLVMSVNPGYGGQQFLPSSLARIARLVQLRQQQQQNFMVAVDGGVNLDTAAPIRAAGADLLVSGSGFFLATDPRDYCQKMRGLESHSG